MYVYIYIYPVYIYIYIYIYMQTYTGLQESMLQDLICHQDMKINVHMRWRPKHSKNIF